MIDGATAFAAIVQQRSFWAYKGQGASPTPRPSMVRIARPDEEDKIFDVLIMLSEENAIAPTNEERIRAMIRRCRGPENGKMRDGVIGLIDAPNGGGIAATCAVVMSQPWYSLAWYCEEIWTYVLPDYRAAKMGHAKALLNFEKWWAEQLGMPLFVGIISKTRTLGKMRLYSREMPLVGASFLWRGAS